MGPPDEIACVKVISPRHAEEIDATNYRFRLSGQGIALSKGLAADFYRFGRSPWDYDFRVPGARELYAEHARQFAEQSSEEDKKYGFDIVYETEGLELLAVLQRGEHNKKHLSWDKNKDKDRTSSYIAGLLWHLPDVWRRRQNKPKH